jgi:hypothetical protein
VNTDTGTLLAFHPPQGDAGGLPVQFEVEPWGWALVRTVAQHLAFACTLLFVKMSVYDVLVFRVAVDGLRSWSNFGATTPCGGLWHWTIGPAQPPKVA